MSILRELYQSLILDHGRRPRNFVILPDANRIKEGFNPLCGDRLTIYLKLDQGIVSRLAFQGCGCAISIASTSLMTEFLQGKALDEIKEIFQLFHAMVTGQDVNSDFSALGKLAVLKGVTEFPARVKCATLAWHTLIAAINNSSETVTTE